MLSFRVPRLVRPLERRRSFVSRHKATPLNSLSPAASYASGIDEILGANRIRTWYETELDNSLFIPNSPFTVNSNDASFPPRKHLEKREKINKNVLVRPNLSDLETLSYDLTRISIRNLSYWKNCFTTARNACNVRSSNNTRNRLNRWNRILDKWCILNFNWPLIKF